MMSFMTALTTNRMPKCLSRT